MAVNADASSSASGAPASEAATAAAANLDPYATQVTTATIVDETQNAEAETPGTNASKVMMKAKEEPPSFSEEDLEIMKENNEATPAVPYKPDDPQEVPPPLYKLPLDVNALSPNGVEGNDPDPKPDDDKKDKVPPAPAPVVKLIQS